MTIINITDSDVSELVSMTEKLDEKNLYLYWLLKEKNDETLYNNMKESLQQVIEQYRKQISKMYMLNLVEQNLLGTTNTQINQVMTNLKNKLDSKEVLNDYIINGLFVSNLDSIFSSDNELELSYALVLSDDVKEQNKNNKYLTSAIGYANSFGTRKKINKTMKKIPNFVQ